MPLTYDLNVTSLQAIALNLMNGGKKKTYEELKQELRLDDSVLKPLMHSLSCGKYKVISKSPASNKINSTDSFVANAKFSSNTRKIRIPMASLDATHNAKKVDEDRNYAIEASIVGTMKARKALKHQQLVAEVLSQLAFFKPNPRAIKKRIESLIDREYLERSADDSQLYNYLA
ncbi:cullin [Chaetoceros tenuissimus]|uniref:Cullin n=1 Tax=Chaetoceros tenuissimus TaxID=426638 RepID=A0AAD3D3A8_9STRA|nr:cullin [Chaetoceros tenuissimus]